MVLPARIGDESMLTNGWVSTLDDQMTSPVARFSAYSVPLLSGEYTRSPATSGAGAICCPSLRFQISVPSLDRTAWKTPLQSPKYTVPSTTAGVLVTPESPSIRQRGVRRATLAGEIFFSAGFVRLF